MSVIEDTNVALDVLIIQVADAGSGKSVEWNPVFAKIFKDIKTMLGKNEEFYRSAVKDLTGDKVDETLSVCFDDGKVNWGRIVAVFTLLYVYVEKVKDCHKCKRDLKGVFRKVLLKHAAPWIRNQGGMSAYVNQHSISMQAVIYTILGACTIMMIKDAYRCFSS